MIKLVVSDIDGVWTDGGMYYTEAGDEFKKFNVADGIGVLLLKQVDIPVLIITGEDRQLVKRRAEKLGIEYFLGVKNKLTVLKNYLSTKAITLEEVAYIGDEINDLPVLKTVGLSACPKGCSSYVTSVVDIELTRKGGQGVFKEFAMHVLRQNNLLDVALNLLEQKY